MLGPRRSSSPRVHTPIDPARVRQLPPHFAWVDHRLRDRLRSLTLEEIALLFFLHLAADRFGCSYWSDHAIAERTGLHPGEVERARHGLHEKRLILFRFPVFQLLSLPENSAS